MWGPHFLHQISSNHTHSTLHIGTQIMHSRWGPHLLGHLQFGPLDKDRVGPTQHVIITLHTPYAATIRIYCAFALGLGDDKHVPWCQQQEKSHY